MKSTTKVKMEHSKQRKICDFNEIFTCALCGGYMIDPTAVENCGHTYCRSCILKHLLKSAHCPECGNDSKPINAEHLRQDNILRSLIYKMMPNVYQAEKQRQIKYYSNKKRHSSFKFESEALNQEEVEDGFFMPAEPISLSLEYHPALLEDCQNDEIPPIRYLQCPASVQIQHLKRFLCSKFALDPQNDRVTVEIIYEDEILPDSFMLMDVGYCYNWKREAPMRFMYRVMVYDQPPSKAEIKLSDSNEEPKTKSHKTKTSMQKSLKSVTFAEKATMLELEPETTEVPKSSTIVETKVEEKHQAPVKVVIARKPSIETRKSGSKRSHAHKSNAQTDEPVAPTNDFKSLRSNDIRFNDYTVTTTTTTTTNSKTKSAATTAATKTNTSTRLASKSSLSSSLPSPLPSSSSLSLPQASVVPIVVSIPQSQVAKSPYAFDEQTDNLSLAQLKNACKKSPNLKSPKSKNQNETSTKNVPKLKIELNSLKAKISIPKPKSADAIYDTKNEQPPPSKKSKHRKHSLDESGPITGKVDLETYAKNIGLKPIEVVAPAIDDAEKTLKYSPNASPMSSCSSSTTSSSNGNFPAFGEFCITSSSHKKHKKKHSRESREPKESKRRKLHAEISSQPADESLKMKVKITTTPATHSHKTHKSKTTPPTTPAAPVTPTEPKICITPPKSPPKIEQQHTPVTGKASQSDGLSASTKSKPIPKSESSINIVALNKTLGEEALSIKKLIRGEKAETTVKPQTPQRQPLLLPKPVTNIKESQELPTSPPLPPSLFKTTPLTFSTHASSNLKTTSSVSKANETARMNSAKPSSASPSAKSQTFAVPSLPRSKYLSAPSSIASSANKQAASLLQLKRSASLDDSNSLLSKQQRLEQDRLVRKSMYGPAVGNNTSASPAKLLQQQFPSKEEAMAAYYPPLMTSFVLPQQRAATSSAMPSPALNITKFNDAILKSTGLLPSTGMSSTALPMPRTPTLPTLTQAQLNLLAASAAYQPLPGIAKSPLEIVRLPSATSSVESPLLPPPLIPPKINRLMGPPVSIANKAKKSAPLSPSTIAAAKISPFLMPSSVNSTTATVAQKTVASNSNNTAAKKVAFRSSPPALINFRSALPIKPAPVKSALASPPIDPLRLSPNANEAKKSNGMSSANQTTKAPIKSLREFRPISKDNSVDILDLSGGKSIQKEFQCTKSNTSSTATTNNSLEAALNKVKQSISACTVTTVDKSLNSATCTTTTARADDLQNLHMLSESATAREKISLKTVQPTISTTTALTSSLSNSFYEKPKQQAATLVRQQNASVRNIPNPSALAFRNQQPPTTAAAATTTTTTASSTVTSPSTSTAADSKPSTKTEAKTSNTSPTTSASTTPPHRPTKKLTTIDQVAATLNIRAAAAEASAARAASVAAATTTQDDVASSAVPLSKSTAEPTAAAIVQSSSSNPKTESSNATSTATLTVTATATTITTTTTAAANTTAVATNSTPEANATAIENNSTKQVVQTVTPSPSLTTAANKTTTETQSTITSVKQPSAALNNNGNNNNNKSSNNNNNNNTSSSDNNNKSNASNNNNNSNNNNSSSTKSNNLTPASTSAPLSTPLSLSSSSLSSVSESNQTGLVVQGSV